jgi:hypothetical protein
LAKRLAEEGKTSGGLFIPDQPRRSHLNAERTKRVKESSGAEETGEMGGMGM